MVDMVELNDVAPCQRASVAPSPTDADARVVKVGDFVVGDAVLAALTDPNSDSAVENLAAINDCAVNDFIAVSLLCWVFSDYRFADFDAASA